MMLSVEPNNPRLTEERVRGIVHSEYQRYLHRQKMLRRMAASMAFLGLLAGGHFFYKKEASHPLIAQKADVSMLYGGGGQNNLESNIAQLLATAETGNEAIKSVLESIRTQDLNTNLLKIKALAQLSKDEQFYFQALAHLQHQDIETAKNLLNQISDAYPSKKIALDLLRYKVLKD